MIIDRLEQREVRRGIERSARVRWRGGELRVAIAAPPALAGPQEDASPFICAALLVAMRRGEDLEVDGRVSPQLLRGCAAARDLYRAWCPDLHPSGVIAAELLEPGPPAGGTAAFFSRGIDSTYSATVPRTTSAPLEKLVFVDRLEPLHDEVVRASEVRLAQEAAALIGLPLAVIETNVRMLTDPVVGDWEDMVGAGLAMVANALPGGIAHMVIPSTDGPMTVTPCGTSPLLDPLFSTEAVTIHHDSVALGRVAKTIWLARERPHLLARLKVCFAENRPDNCGRCPKCLLTMMGLQAVGALEAAEQFPDEIDVDAVAAMSAGQLRGRVELAEAAHALDRTVDRPLVQAILAGLRRAAEGSSRRPVSDRSPGFRRHHTLVVEGLLREGRPWPAHRDIAMPGDGARLGLVRTVDRSRRRHVYGVGSVAPGDLAGELGSLLAYAERGTRPVWMTAEGRVVVAGDERPRPRPSAGEAARWILGPLVWRGVDPGLAARLRATLGRSARVAVPPRRQESTERGAPIGHIHEQAGPARLALYSAVHPVTGDQLLTTDPREVDALGYCGSVVLGHLEAHAPVTGALGTRQVSIPWAVRFGQLRDTH